jgi:CheY-like chemotaxis protein
MTQRSTQTDRQAAAASDQPARPSEKLTPPRAPEDLLGAEKHLILLVDDERSILILGERMLTSLGYRVAVAQNAQKAVEVVREQAGTLDLVLLDLAMPNVDGIDCLRELRLVAPGLPVLLCTGHVEDETREMATTLGALGVLHKPFELNQLRAAVVEALLVARAFRS